MRRHEQNVNTLQKLLIKNRAKKPVRLLYRTKYNIYFNKSSVAYHIEPPHRVTIPFNRKYIWRLTKRFKIEFQLRRKVYARFIL